MTDPSPGENRPHLPAPTVWPVGFAVGVACLLVGLIVSWVAVAIGGAITILFGFLWIRDLTGGVRHAEPPPAPAPPVETGPAPPAQGGPAGVPPGERFPRSRFLEGATLGLGALIGGVVTVPPVGLLVASAFEGQKFRDIDLGPISDFPSGKFMITTFVEDPSAGEVSRRTAYIRYNGAIQVSGKSEPSFTVLSNRCAHLGCPVQPNGPVASKPSREVTDKAGNVTLRLTEAQPAGFGCPCHGGQYDTEGNRTAGPPVRGLDRYSYSIKDGHLILGGAYSVDYVRGTGKDARIKKYPLHNPGQHVAGPEFWLWPIPEIRA